MSLTSHLSVPSSPVRRFLEERFFIVTASAKGAPFSEQIGRALGLPDIPRKPVRPPASRPQFRAAVGTALDYRIRYILDGTAPRKIVAAYGAALLTKAGVLALPGHRVFAVSPKMRAYYGEPPLNAAPAAALAESFFANHAARLARLKPFERRLTREEEGQLIRDCVVLAYFEALYRAGLRINSPLYAVGTGASLDDLLALPPEDVVADACGLAEDAYEDVQPLLKLPASLNPVFDGSADADFVIGSALFEVKTVSQFSPLDLRKCLLQLLGYTLLDYSDTFGIHSIAIWLTRQRHMSMWDIDGFLFPVSDLISGGQFAEAEVTARLSETRAAFREMLKSDVGETMPF
ncbi:MAG: hypothetical protein Q8P00_05225 [Dehalococcoidia bacterium]|nr:hypothetical protein [Dehalococcoidia bacterium]